MVPESSLLSAERLRDYPAFNQLGDDDRLVLASRIPVRRASLGDILFRCGDIDSIDIFLLAGRLQLIAEDGRERTIDASSEVAKLPIARLRPRQYTAKALTTVEYFEVDRDLLEALSEQRRKRESIDVGYGVVELDADTDEAQQMLQAFRHDLESNRFVLNSLPEVALKIRSMLDDYDVGAAQLARVINRDPAIAAKVIRAANSSLYFGVSKCETLTEAIVRLGLVTTRQLVLGFALRDLFNSGSPALRKRMTAVWEQSLDVAAISFVLARHTHQFSPEEAMLGGLVSNIGVLAVLNYAENYPKLLADEALLDHWIDTLRSEAGAMVLAHWEFPPELVDVAWGCYDWQRCPGSQADLCDLVLIANLHSFIGKRRRPAPPPIDQVPAFGKLNLGKLTPEMTLQVLAEARGQLDEARSLLAA